MHSVWSDGSQTLADIAAAGGELGYASCGVTDHSYGNSVTRHRNMVRPVSSR
jgi:histidinol phosphatase-like PHP family hydrolase